MSDTGLAVFDKTLQTTHLWLGDLEKEYGQDKAKAWHLLTATLRVLRDWLPADLAAHLGAQLPMLIRGAYYEQYAPAKQPEGKRSQEAFLQQVQAAPAPMAGIGPEAVTSVFNVLSRHLDGGLVDKLRQALPEDVRTLWPAQQR